MRDIQSARHKYLNYFSITFNLGVVLSYVNNNSKQISFLSSTLYSAYYGVYSVSFLNIIIHYQILLLRVSNEVNMTGEHDVLLNVTWDSVDQSNIYA